METEAGVKLDEEEIKLIKSLQRLAKRWEKHGKDLWLYSASGSLHVMLKGDRERNPEPEMVPRYGGVNPVHSVTVITGITNDGGDW